MVKRMPQILRLAASIASTLFSASVVAVLTVAATSLSAQAQTFRVLYSFDNPPDAGFPTSTPVLDQAGNLYGTTVFNGLYFGGTVFRIDPEGNESVLFNFTGGADGALPYAGVIVGADGNLYGTTTQGGDNTCQFPLGCGVVFMMDTSGNETVLHAFAAGTDAEIPYAALVRDGSGNLYGTTVGGVRLRITERFLKYRPIAKRPCFTDSKEKVMERFHSGLC